MKLLAAISSRSKQVVAAIRLANKLARIGVNEITPDNRRDMKVGRATARYRAGRSGDQDNPLVSSHSRMRDFDRDLIRLVTSRQGPQEHPLCRRHAQLRDPRFCAGDETRRSSSRVFFLGKRRSVPFETAAYSFETGVLPAIAVRHSECLRQLRKSTGAWLAPTLPTAVRQRHLDSHWRNARDSKIHN